LRLNEDLTNKILGFCRRIADSNPIMGVCICGFTDLDTCSKKIDVEVLAVIQDFQPRIMVYFKPLNRYSLIVSAVDQWVFEKDVEKAFIGEVVAEKIAFYYQPITGKEYFKEHETKVKKRIICELLETLILEFPELSREFLIEPKYFLYETMIRRAKLFPSLTYNFLNMLHRGRIKVIMQGYRRALKRLEEEGIIEFSGEYIQISEKFIEKIRSKKMRIPAFFKNFQKAFFAYTLGILPKTVNVFLQYREKIMKVGWNKNGENLVFRLENPRKFIHVHTSLGVLPLSEGINIDDFVKKIAPNKTGLRVDIKEIGGILNDVYLINLKDDSQERKIIVKRFMDWQNFKWFSLALWTLGTRSFAVHGRFRLEKEYALNKFLHSKGISVPRILHVSLRERLIFREYVEGEEVTEVVKRIFKAERKSEVARELEIIREVGRKMACIHELNVSLGDTKPENILISNGEVLFLDLEQASRNGNQPWDIAEFLYYAGHYASLITNIRTVTWLTQAFIKGYLDAGGKLQNVEKAASPIYTKVFGIFTLPHVILKISSLCKKLAKQEEKKRW